MSTYENLRSAIRSGDLLLFRGHGFWSSVIRRATKSDYCHCGVAWVVSGRVMVLEARQATGVSVRMLSEALPADWISIGLEWSEDVEEYALKRLQTKYSLLAAAALGLGVTPPAGLEACSLFAAEVISRSPSFGATIVERRGMTPGHLAEILEAGGLQLRALN